MPLFLIIIMSLMAILFGSIFLMFIIAGIIDLINHRKRKKDLFYQLSCDYNKVKRPAAK